MDKKIQKITLAAIVVTVLIFMALSYDRAPILQDLEGTIYNSELSLVPEGKNQASPVALVAIDEKSLREQGPWPWPRNLIARIVDRVTESHPKVIGLYLPLLAEEKNHGLAEVQDFEQRLKIYPPAKNAGDLRDWIQQNLEQMEKRLNHDALLVESIKQSGRVVLPVKGHFNDVAQSEEYPLLAGNFLSSGKAAEEDKSLPVAGGLDLPFPALSKAALGFGHDRFESFHSQVGPGSHPVYIGSSGGLLPSFPLTILIHYKNQTARQVLVQQDRIQIQDSVFPLSSGELLFKFRHDSSAFATVSAADLLSDRGKFSFSDKIVLIGRRTADDQTVETPVGKISKMEITAHILDSMVNRRIVSRPSMMNLIEILLIPIFGLISGLLYPRYGNPGRFGWTLALIFLVLLSGFILLTMNGIWLKTGTIAVSMLAVFFVYWLVSSVFGEAGSKESVETSRLLGLSFQSQGLLDLAFDKFRKIPLNDETRDLLYNLGLEYEKKRMINKALEAYEYIRQDGTFRDLNDRIPRLQESDKSSTLGSHSLGRESSILADSSAEGRTKVGRYEIIEELGKGSMGLVYKALDPKINRVVAIKTIRFSDEFDEDVINEIKERFFREAEIAGQLSHTSIVTIHDVGDDQDLTYMAMEFLEGEDLEKYIEKGHLLPLRKVLDVVSQVAEALDFAHQSEVIHRDIKPANIMIMKNGRVKVTDFGIAKAISSSRTRTGVILGTPNYMSPEQIMGQKIDPRSDIFSLGVLFFQLLTGELPFHGENLSSLLYQITQVKHPSVREKNQKIPKACEQIIDKAMAKNQNERFNRAGEMARVLKVLISKIDALIKKKQASG